MLKFNKYGFLLERKNCRTKAVTSSAVRDHDYTSFLQINLTFHKPTNFHFTNLYNLPSYKPISVRNTVLSSRLYVKVWWLELKLRRILTHGSLARFLHIQTIQCIDYWNSV